jgi:hypothetical protein
MVVNQWLNGEIPYAIENGAQHKNGDGKAKPTGVALAPLLTKFLVVGFSRLSGKSDKGASLDAFLRSDLGSGFKGAHVRRLFGYVHSMVLSSSGRLTRSIMFIRYSSEFFGARR